MKSTILISRIARIIETDGAVGEGDGKAVGDVDRLLAPVLRGEGKVAIFGGLC